MKHLLVILALLALPLAAAEPKIAIVGLVHSHVWGHLANVAKGNTPAKLVAVAEPNAELQAEAKKVTGPEVQYYEDYKAMLKETKPEIVWAFVENNRHLEIVQACAPLNIQIMFEKPLASTYADALAIERLAKKHGIRVMTNYQMAWWGSNYTAKAQADAGALGKVWRLRGVVGHGGPGSQGARNKYFFNWLTDPVQNGAGSLMDFGCYNALWSLWYMGKPETVYATVNHLRPEIFPKVEDNSTMILHYKNGVGLFEGSWDLPRSFQDLEIFGQTGSLYMTGRSVEVRERNQTKPIDIQPLPKERAEPVAYMVQCMQENKPLEGLTALEINRDVVEIIEAAKQSVATGRAVKLPLPAGKKKGK
ncbi:MAG TPA: Gfo/Idh/MocA family oxidoreductase [Bryobacteraceae bacterium]|nr:Gfo/Idh/MocA family oxidoreductase [Bryobacteraceae bacterium]